MPAWLQPSPDQQQFSAQNPNNFDVFSQAPFKNAILNQMGNESKPFVPEIKNPMSADLPLPPHPAPAPPTLSPINSSKYPALAGLAANP